MLVLLPVPCSTGCYRRSLETASPLQLEPLCAARLREQPPARRGWLWGWLGGGPGELCTQEGMRGPWCSVGFRGCFPGCALFRRGAFRGFKAVGCRMVWGPLRGAAGLARELQEAGGAPALTTAQPPRAELSAASVQCGWLQEKGFCPLCMGTRSCWLGVSPSYRGLPPLYSFAS